MINVRELDNGRIQRLNENVPNTCTDIESFKIWSNVSERKERKGRTDTLLCLIVQIAGIAITNTILHVKHLHYGYTQHYV